MSSRATLREHDGVAVIDLRGDVNSSAEAALNEAYAEAADGGTGCVARPSLARNYRFARWLLHTAVRKNLGHAGCDGR
jgi:CobQ-like glutamine amidotransferase family enzyme